MRACARTASTRRRGRIIGATMCEHFVARAAEPFRLDELWPFTERLERFGIAGWGWGAAWATNDGSLARTATSGRSATIRAATRSGGSRRPRRSSTSAGRRSSRRSALADTQPFDDPAGRFAFSHNGDLRDIGDVARRYRDAGPDPRPGRHRGRRALARGRAGTTGRARGPLLRALHDHVRWPGEPRD